MHAVVVFVWVVDEYELCYCAGSSFRENKVSVICFAEEDHVTCVIPEGAVWLLVEIVHEHLDFLVVVFCWCGVFGCYFIE